MQHLTVLIVKLGSYLLRLLLLWEREIDSLGGLLLTLIHTPWVSCYHEHEILEIPDLPHHVWEDEPLSTYGTPLGSGHHSDGPSHEYFS